MSLQPTCTTNMYNQHVQPTCTTPCTILHVHWWVHPAILRCWNQTRSSPVCSEKVNNISISGQTGWSNMVITVEKYNHTTTHFLFRRHWCTVGGGALSASAAAFWTSTRKGAAETRVKQGLVLEWTIFQSVYTFEENGKKDEQSMTHLKKYFWKKKQYPYG